MKIELVSKNYSESSKIMEVIEKKLKKLDKYFAQDATAKVALSSPKKDAQTLEITIFQSNMPVPARAEVISPNMYDNVDIIVPKLEKQIVKYRTRQEHKKKARGAQISLAPEHNEIEKAASHYGKVVKVKNYAISIIPVEEAIEELELLDHNFFVFVNAENNKVSVVYKRLDNDYGLITPEY